MKPYKKYYPVNWTEGMKLNKDIFIAQDNAVFNSFSLLASTSLSPIKYGILPNSTFNISIAVDNQGTARVTVNDCKALTIGGVYIDINANAISHTDGNPSVTLSLSNSSEPNIFWVVLMVHPYERIPFGDIDPNESPTRLPFVKEAYAVHLIESNQLGQYEQHPHALIIGKIKSTGNSFVVDDQYLPPCMAVSALPDLIGLHAELDSFLANLEQNCSIIVQKIYKKSQQNELSELAKFLCDRVILYLSQSITNFRWLNIHESPAVMISQMVALARAIKNTIDLRIGSGREELMNYLCEWSDLKQGELEKMLSGMAQLRYNHNDVNENISTIIEFAKTIGKLFSTLSSLEFIGKRKESGLFVKEEIAAPSHFSEEEKTKPKRRFFG